MFLTNEYKAMKIGFDAKRAFNNSAGLGNFSRNSISALVSKYPDNQYFLFNPGNRKPLFIAPESSIELKPENFWWKRLKFIWRSIQISKLAKEIKLDLYHGLSHELPVGIEKVGAKLIVTMHDLIFLRYPEYYKPIDRKIYDRKFRHAFLKADFNHAHSEPNKPEFENYYSIPEKKKIFFF